MTPPDQSQGECPTCGRRPSDAYTVLFWEEGSRRCDQERERCPDPIHDLADNVLTAHADLALARNALANLADAYFEDTDSTNYRCCACDGRAPQDAEGGTDGPILHTDACPYRAARAALEPAP